MEAYLASFNFSDSSETEVIPPEVRLLKPVEDKIQTVPDLFETPSWESDDAMFLRLKYRADYFYFKRDFQESLNYKM